MPTKDKDGAHLRVHPRIKIFQPAEMSQGSGQAERVHLLNISKGGAMVHCAKAPGVGEVVRLVCGAHLGLARVQWSNGRSFGVAFAQPISSEQIERLVRMQDEMIR